MLLSRAVSSASATALAVSIVSIWSQSRGPSSRRSDRPAAARRVWRVAACYPPRTVRRIEIRLHEGPNVSRLEPVVKVEVAVGRRRTWYGQRNPGRHALVRLGATGPAPAPPIQAD